jgi:glucokinase
MSPHLFLAGDIGGTNARFMLFEVDDEQLSQPIARGQRYVTLWLSYHASY